ncbi:protein-cysteine N-palmitoyltransferase Rasp [Ischnura elegans]|uniref:protein-cysteine N-palmitoyltransferase Rasp n=1 Tax=Ischnura elegans TaxID=197161 RepID=UPI001ED89ED8|nr:protein-cysteine N-palmitoyltransferase Rasp [Ischnura elegans]
MANVPKIEIIIYFCVWSTGIFYSIYKVYLIGNRFVQNTQYDDFSVGWPITSRMKDVSDFEWNSMFPMLCSVSPWFVIHTLMQGVVNSLCNQYLMHSYFLITSTCIIYFFGISILLMFLVQPLVFFLILQLRSKGMVWLSCIGFLTLLNMHPVTKMEEIHHLPHTSQYLVSVTLSWIHLRCISFCLEKLSVDCIKSAIWQEEISNLLGYVFYLPLFFFGPVMLYKEFYRGSCPKKRLDWPLLESFLLNLVRFCSWAAFNEISLHYIYCSALAFQPDVVYGMDSWTLFGFGYCMGQFFMNKYTVLYGIPATFARLERYDAPPHPKCIGRIHLYSDMWKYFDVGLYSFLVRYIFIPACGKTRKMRKKLFSSFLCFTFVYIWHGTNLYILVWSTLNFLGITIEAMAKTIYMTPTYQHWELKWFSVGWSQRFHALLASPLLMMSALSNFYFFGGMEIGNIFVQKILEGWNGVTIFVLLFLYCCCHVSVATKNWEKQKAGGSKELGKTKHCSTSRDKPKCL